MAACLSVNRPLILYPESPPYTLDAADGDMAGLGSFSGVVASLSVLFSELAFLEAKNIPLVSL